MNKICSYTSQNDPAIKFEVYMLGKHQFKVVPPSSLPELNTVFLKQEQAEKYALALSTKKTEWLFEKNEEKTFTSKKEKMVASGGSTRVFSLVG